MLDRAKRIITKTQVYRVTQEPQRGRIIRQLHKELGDGREFAEALEFLGVELSLGALTVQDLLANSFGPPIWPGRFSNGSYPVLYTARSRRTASREYGYWARYFYNPVDTRPYRIRLLLVSCHVEGPSKDVRRFLKEFPWLIADDHTKCQELGAAARADGLYCLIAPSARDRPRGVTVPVFERDAVSQGRQEGEVVFTIGMNKPVRFRTKVS